ncbi:hypothetical protein D3C84_905260 [compost metagenome]
MQLQFAVFQAGTQYLQGGIHRLAQGRGAMVVATPGKGAQAGGDPAHAVDQLIHGAQVGTGGIQGTALEEAHGVA